MYYSHVYKQEIRACVQKINALLFWDWVIPASTFHVQNIRHQNVLQFVAFQFIWRWICSSWWRHQMETFSALLASCAGNSPVTGEFPAQRPVTKSLMFSFICVWINDVCADVVGPFGVTKYNKVIIAKLIFCSFVLSSIYVFVDFIHHTSPQTGDMSHHRDLVRFDVMLRVRNIRYDRNEKAVILFAIVIMLIIFAAILP